MKEHPILFSEELIPAILNGSKTQTRRIVKDRHLSTVNEVLKANGKWVWSVMDVVSVDYPFIVMKNRSKTYGNGIHSFDSRDIILDWPSQEYKDLANQM